MLAEHALRKRSALCTRGKKKKKEKTSSLRSARSPAALASRISPVPSLLSPVTSEVPPLLAHSSCPPRARRQTPYQKKKKKKKHQKVTRSSIQTQMRRLPPRYWSAASIAARRPVFFSLQPSILSCSRPLFLICPRSSRLLPFLVTENSDGLLPSSMPLAFIDVEHGYSSGSASVVAPWRPSARMSPAFTARCEINRKIGRLQQRLDRREFGGIRLGRGRLWLAS